MSISAGYADGRAGLRGSAYTGANTRLARRERASAKTSRLAMLITLAVVCTVLTLEGVQLARMSAVSQSIRAIQADNRVLTSKLDHINGLLSMETRPDIVAEKAMAKFNMVMPDASEVRILVLTRGRETDEERTNTVYAEAR